MKNERFFIMIFSDTRVDNSTNGRSALVQKMIKLMLKMYYIQSNMDYYFDLNKNSIVYYLFVKAIAFWFTFHIYKNTSIYPHISLRTCKCNLTLYK
jgi:hypothetical protein